MTNPWPRRLRVFSVVAAIAIIAALAPRAPRPLREYADLHDAVGDHRALLGVGHSTLSCVNCHFAHPAKSPRPLWQTQGAADSSLFARESDRAGGVQTGLCMSCHDGTVAPALQTHGSSLGAQGFTALGANPGANHPVGVDYMAALRRDPGSYNDPAMNSRIVLEDGNVGCVSCHATHEVTGVSSVNVRQEVCIECHRR